MLVKVLLFIEKIQNCWNGKKKRRFKERIINLNSGQKIVNASWDVKNEFENFLVRKKYKV